MARVSCHWPRSLASTRPPSSDLMIAFTTLRKGRRWDSRAKYCAWVFAHRSAPPQLLGRRRDDPFGLVIPKKRRARVSKTQGGRVCVCVCVCEEKQNEGTDGTNSNRVSRLLSFLVPTKQPSPKTRTQQQPIKLGTGRTYTPGQQHGIRHVSRGHATLHGRFEVAHQQRSLDNRLARLRQGRLTVRHPRHPRASATGRPSSKQAAAAPTSRLFG